MKSKVLLVILVVVLTCPWSGVSSAGQIGYSMRSSEKGFGVTPQPGPSSSAAMAADALIGRPLGLATTIAGTAVFVITLPFSIPSESTDDAAWGLVGRPGGWTFVRPMGRGAPEYEERGVFRP
jgi:hypothetical protein